MEEVEYIENINERAYQTGIKAGKACKGILERIQANETKEKLKEFGIDIKSKTFDEILKEISEVYKETNNEDLLEIMVGKCNKYKLQSLLEGINI